MSGMRHSKLAIFVHFVAAVCTWHNLQAQASACSIAFAAADGSIGDEYQKGHFPNIKFNATLRGCDGTIAKYSDCEQCFCDVVLDGGAQLHRIQSSMESIHLGILSAGEHRCDIVCFSSGLRLIASARAYVDAKSSDPACLAAHRRPLSRTPNIEADILAVKAVANSYHSFDSGSFQGKGIVLAAGGPHLLLNAWVLVRTLRWLGSKMPVELFYCGPEEMIGEWAIAASELDVVVIDATAVGKDSRTALRGWPLKIHSVMHSSFQEVLFLDVDSVPLHNPDQLFFSPAYQEHGAVFSVDFTSDPHWIPPDLFALLGLEWKPFVSEFESGQFLIDKSRVWKAMQVVTEFNARYTSFFMNMYGDKDTWRLAFALSNTSYVTMRHPDLLGTVVDGHPASDWDGEGIENRPFLCGNTMLHAWPSMSDGDWAFAHRTLSEWNATEIDCSASLSWEEQQQHLKILRTYENATDSANNSFGISLSKDKYLFGRPLTWTHFVKGARDWDVRSGKGLFGLDTPIVNEGLCVFVGMQHPVLQVPNWLAAVEMAGSVFAAEVSCSGVLNLSVAEGTHTEEL